jgi:hypothetical protein
MSAEPVDYLDDDDAQILRPDGRKRVTLGPMAHHDRYLAHDSADGTIVLEPAVVVTKRAVAFWDAHPEVAQNIRETRANPNRAGHPWPAK